MLLTYQTPHLPTLAESLDQEIPIGITKLVSLSCPTSLSFSVIVAKNNGTSQVPVLVHRISDTNSSLVIARSVNQQILRLRSEQAPQSQSEIPRFRSEQGLPRFPFTEPVLSGEILRFAQNDRSEGFRALAHRNDGWERSPR